MIARYKYTPQEIGELNREIDRLRAALRAILELGHERDLPDAWNLARAALKGE